MTQDVNNEKHADLNIEPIILFNKEKSSLQALPKQSVIDAYISNRKKQKVTSESLVRFRGKGFSVEPQYINCYVELEQQQGNLII